MADEASYNEWVKTKNPKMIRSLTRMVFLKFKKDGRIDQFLMTIVGDKEYHENQVSRLSDNAYLSREKHFSGHIYYHDLTGKFVNGWVYEKGKLEGITFLKEGQSLPTELKMATTCITTTQYTTYVECTDWYRDYDFDGEAETYTNTTCGSTFVATSTFTECPVYFTGLDGTGTSYLSATGSGGANGGYNPTLQPPCNCANICDVCGKCKDELLKSGSVNCIPWDDCSCLPPNPYSDPNRPCLGDPIKYATICPTSSGRVTGGLYGCRRVGDTDCNEGIYDKFHGGVDISAPIGSDIYTMHPGKVKYVGYESGGLGNYIIIASEIGGQTLDITYGHLSNTNVGVNNRVFENTIIGQSGDSGNAGGSPPHVHIQIFISGSRVDPLPYFATSFDPNTGNPTQTPCLF